MECTDDYVYPHIDDLTDDQLEARRLDERDRNLDDDEGVFTRGLFEFLDDHAMSRYLCEICSGRMLAMSGATLEAILTCPIKDKPKAVSTSSIPVSRAMARPVLTSSSITGSWEQLRSMYQLIMRTGTR